MNKKLIALAVAAAFAAPAAMAEVELYGRVHVDINFGENDDTVNSRASRLGFKGAEDLGNGLKALWKYELNYDVTDGNGVDSVNTAGTSMSARDSYLGLSGDFGSVLVGRMASPNKAALYAAGNVHLADSIADFANDYVSKGNWSNTATEGKGRTSNAIAYFSPAMSGFKLIAAIVPQEDDDGNGTRNSANDDNGLADYYGAAVTYAGHGLKAAAGMTSNSDADIDVYNLGASYTFGNFTVGGNYENEEVGTDERDVIGVAGKASFGNNAVIANYKLIDVNGTETDDVSLALQHSFSKRSSVYVAYQMEDTDGGTDTDQFSLGMIHNF